MLKFFATKRGKMVLNNIFSIGAAIVIFGALAKIEHWGGILSHALELGMLTETCVFILMTMIPPEKEFHWDRFFPDITESPEEEMARTGEYKPTPLPIGGGGFQSGNPALKGLDDMLVSADITPVNLKKLSDNFSKLDATLGKMAEIADLASVTGDYTKRTQEASAALENMKEVYQNAASAVAAFNNSAESTRQFHEQIQYMTKNLASLNAIYELELQDTNNHLKAMNHFYSNLTNASQTMSESAADAKKTQEQIALLAKNLSSLNAVYGNMLSAMQSGR